MIIDDQDDVLTACLFPNDTREYLPGAHLSRVLAQTRRDAAVEQDSETGLDLLKSDEWTEELYPESARERVMRLCKKIFGNQSHEAELIVERICAAARADALAGTRYSH